MLYCAHELDRLRELLALEDHEATQREHDLRSDSSPKQLEARGLLLRNARVTDERPILFGRVRVTLGEDVSRPGHFGLFSSKPGNVVRLKSEDEILGIIQSSGPGWMAIVFDESLGSDVQKVDLELAPDLVTLQRLKDALASAEQSRGRTARLVNLILGCEAPKPTRLNHFEVLDEQLNDDQREAVRHGIGAPDVALIHGPPGTGKTRTLVEVIRQCVARGEKVLCLAASNAATDNLAKMLLTASPNLPLVRLGHPARTHEVLEEYTLSGLTEKHPQRILAKGLVRDALTLLKSKSSERGRPTREQREERKQRRLEARRIFDDVRKLERQATETIMSQAKVVCGTLTGFLREVGEDAKFDLLVIDEASQALTPALLPGILRCQRIVLAGDHRQLPPTVISAQAQRGGLSTTAFDVLMGDERFSECRHMLTVQHRMAPELMAFPSAEFYHGKLSADESVSNRRVELSSYRIDMPLKLVDTAGAGLDENREDENSSIENQGHADLVIRYLRELTEQGVSPSQIAVITPYSAQVQRISHQAGSWIESGLEIDSVDGFQGREKDVIIFDAVQSNADGEVGFLADHRRLNVALTRAKHQLIVIADAATLATDAVWSRFFDFAMTNNGYVSYFELEY